MSAFIKINEKFTCRACREPNPQAKKTCRNHCRKCLYSLHVDESSPGDRQSACHGLMKPFKVDQDGKKGWIIYQKCLKCGRIMPNKAAADDNFEQIIQLSKYYEFPRKQKTGK